MSQAGGSAAAVIVDIMANASQLGQSLQQAEQQIAASSAKMGKSIDGAMQQAEKAAKESGDRIGKTLDNAVGGAGPAGGAAMGRGGRLAQMLGNRQAIMQYAANLGQEVAKDFHGGMDRRTDVAGSIIGGLEKAVAMIPHPAAQLGLALGEILKPYGEAAGKMFGEAVIDGVNMSREAEFEEGTAYGLGDYLSDVINDRNTRQMGRGVRKIANQNLILGRQDELAALQAEQQILKMIDQRGQMMQSKMHLGLAEVQTSMGTFRTGFGTPEEASARVYDAATKQLVALERIESIVKEIGHYSRTAMRN